MANTKIRLPQLNAESLKPADATSLVFKELGIDKAYLTFDTANNDVELGSGDIPVILTGATTLAGALSGASFKDEDNMASDSATAVASQQSIKAYVDAQVTAQDFDFAGDSGGAQNVDLDSQSLTIAGGTGLSSAGSAQTITLALDDTAVTAASYGAAAKTLTATVDAQGRLTAMAEPAIAIAASQVTDFSEAVDDRVGALAVAGEGMDVTYDDAAGTLTFAAEDSAADNKGAVIVAGTANEVTVAYSSGTATVSLPDDVTIGRDLVITRNLTVNGDQFKIDGETVVMDDTLLEMGTVGKAAPTSATTKDMGILIHQHDGSSASLNFMGWDDSASQYVFRTGVTDGGAGILTGLGAAAAVGMGVLTATTLDLDGSTGGLVLDTDGDSKIYSLGDDSIDIRTGGADRLAIIDTCIHPAPGIAYDLGTTSNGFDALHMEAASVINFDGGDVVWTHAAGKLTLSGDGAVELDFGNHEMTNVDINSGDISGVTISGGLTWSSAQNLNSQALTNVNIDSGSIDGTPIAGSSGAFTTLSCNAKALAAAALNINSESSITLAAGDEFAVSDADDSNAIKKTSMADIEAYLAANASSKVISVMTDTVAAGALVSNQNGFPNLASGLVATLNGASAIATKSEVYLNGMLMSRGADGDYSGAATLTEDFAYDTDAAAGSPAPGMIFNFDLVAGDHVVIMVRS